MLSERLIQSHLNALLVCDHYLARYDTDRKIFKQRVKYTQKFHKMQTRQAQKPMDLPEIDAKDVTASRFLELSQNFSHPMVIRGFLRDAASTTKWSDEYFIKVCEGDQYPTRVDTDDGADAETLVTMKDILDRIKDSNSSPYRTNLTRILSDHPVLIKDLELDRLLSLTGNQEDDCFQMVNLFFGGKGSVTPFHCAFAGNFFNNILGKKEWLIIDPKYTNDLMPIPAHPFMFSDVVFHANDSHGTSTDPVLPYFRIVLEPGDLLYNAPWWWHRVGNLTDLTMGCAVRYMKLSADLRNNPLLTLMSESPRLTTKHYLYALRERLLGDKKVLRDFMLREGSSRAVTLRSLLQGAVPVPESVFEDAH